MTVVRFPVEAGHIAIFARAIGDSNPIYLDEEYARASETSGIVAPPTFIQAADHFDPDYDRRPREGETWFGSGREELGAPAPGLTGGGGGLHAEQHFEYHRSIRPGDVLSATEREGGSWEKQGRRGGTLRFSETITEYRDQAGELVITVRFVGVSMEKQVG